MAVDNRDTGLGPRLRIRLLWLGVALLVNMNWHHTTERNALACRLGYIFALARIPMKRPWWFSTFRQEGYHGVLRTMGTRSELTHQDCLYLIQNSERMESIQRLRNWSVPSRAAVNAPSGHHARIDGKDAMPAYDPLPPHVIFEEAHPNNLFFIFSFFVMCFSTVSPYFIE